MRPSIQLAPFTGFTTGTNNYLFPMLFVTVACGAISGFHSLISSGTTSKQINKESDAKFIGYGAMLIESMVAIVSICAAGYYATAKYGEIMKSGGPNTLFAMSCADFLTVFGIPVDFGKIFISLAISAFALTSLDTATRIGRFIFQEFFEKFDAEGKQIKSILVNRYFATIVTVVPGGVIAFMGYSKVWPIFGSANQLLGALAFLGLSAFMIKMGKSAKMFLIPMVFMFAVTFTALTLIIKANIATKNYILLVIGAALLILAIILVIQAWKVFTGKKDTSIKA
jgi:carbon starvation protein